MGAFSTFRLELGAKLLSMEWIYFIKIFNWIFGEDRSNYESNVSIKVLNILNCYNPKFKKVIPDQYFPIKNKTLKQDWIS